MFKNLRNSVMKFLGNSAYTGGFWSWALPGEWTKEILIRQYSRVVYSVISAIAQEAAKVEFIIDTNDKQIKNHPFLQVMKKPNPDQSQFQFLEMHFTFMKLVGESYWYLAKGQKTGSIKEIYIIRPDLMNVVIDKNSKTGAVIGYEMIKPNKGEKEKFTREEIVHFKMPNPSNPYYGMGPVQAGKVYIETEDYSANWTRNSIFNSGRPSGIVNLKGNINEDTFKQLKRQFKDEYTGTKNAGKTLLLKSLEGIDFQKLGMELEETALKEMKDMTKEDIMFMFRVSKTMMGISDDVNRANAQENHAVFIENLIKPELDRFMDHINAFVLPLFDKKGNTVVSYVDMDLRSDKEKLEEWTAGHNKWLTTNDIRIERGLDPIEGGNVLYQSIGMVPITNESEEPPEPQEPTDNPNNPSSQDDEEDTEDEEKSLNGKVKKKELTKADVFKEITIQHQDRWIDHYQRSLNKEFRKQEKEILDNNKASFPQWIFDLKASNQRMMGFFVPMGIDIMREAAKYALDVADDTNTEFQINEKVTKYIQERVRKFSEEMNAETIKLLEETIAEGVRNGENQAKMRKRVREIYGNATTTRSDRIARTETLSASNEGANEAYRQSPLVTGKEWSANYGACEFCMALNGKVVGLDEDYLKLGQTLEGDKGGKYKIGYENIEHPPVHPNCRCALLPVILR